MQRTRSISLAFALIAGTLLPSCLSTQALQGALDDKEQENRALRAERAQLKEQLKIAEDERERLEVSLAEATMRMAERPEAQPASASPSVLDRLEGLDVPVSMRDGRAVITLPASITFGSGKAELTESGRGVLSKIAARLEKEFPGSVISIEGHTDSDPIQKSGFASNRDLSLARAMAVLTYLVEVCHVPDEQCRVVGCGQYEPVAPNDSPESKARNRRVELVVEP